MHSQSTHMIGIKWSPECPDSSLQPSNKQIYPFCWYCQGFLVFLWLSLVICRWTSALPWCLHSNSCRCKYHIGSASRSARGPSSADYVTQYHWLYAWMGVHCDWLYVGQLWLAVLCCSCGCSHSSHVTRYCTSESFVSRRWQQLWRAFTK